MLSLVKEKYKFTIYLYTFAYFYQKKKKNPGKIIWKLIKMVLLGGMGKMMEGIGMVTGFL